MNSPYIKVGSTPSGGGSIDPPPEGVINELILALPAGESISALRIVWANGSAVFPASASNSMEVQRLVGITLSSGDLGDLLQIKRIGTITDGSWSWAPGFIWLGEAGFMTQAPHPSRVNVVIATALSSTTILLLFHEPTFQG